MSALPKTGRSVPEWIGRTPDTDPPPRVRPRVFDHSGGRCQCCGRLLRAGDSWQADHLVALVNGGENRESNLRCVCSWCHGEKSRGDIAEKALIARLRSGHFGIRPKASRPIPGSRASGIRKRMDGTVEAWPSEAGHG